MATGILSIGITGIHAAQAGLQVTQHNIANADTAGYSRQYIQQSAGIPRLTGEGYFGSGTTVSTISRAYDQYLTKQTAITQAKSTESDELLAKLNLLDNMFADSSAGLTPAVQDFFAGVQQVAANPSLVSARQSMISSTQVLVGRFNALADRIGEIYDTVNAEVVGEVDQINSYAQQIADVNGQITKAMASTSLSPNDLLDMRDALVMELNKHVGVTTTEDSFGNFNVFIGNGQQLVVGSEANKLVPMTSSTDPERLVVGYKGPSLSAQELPERLLSGGKLGALIQFRSGALDSAANQFGLVATSLAQTFNAQHALGQDLNGLNATSTTPGFQADYFEIPQPTVLVNDPSAATVTASFLPPVVDSATGNFYSRLNGSDYLLHNSGGTLTLTRLSDKTTWTGNSLAALNSQITGEGISLGGSMPTDGKDYLIEPTRNVAKNIALNGFIAADTARIAAAAPTISTLGTANSGSMTVSQGQIEIGNLVTTKKGNMSISLSGTAPGYTSLSPTRTFTLSGSNFTFTQGSSSVVATYSNGSTATITNGSIPTSSGGFALNGLTIDGVSVSLSGPFTATAPTVPGFTIGSYSFDNTPKTFTYNASTGNFSFPAGGAVTARYADGSSVSIAGTSLPRVSASGNALVGLTLDGINVSVSGVPGNNDTFTIDVNSKGVSDSRNVVRLGSLQTQKTTNSATATYQSAFSSMVSDVGSKTRQVKVNGEAQKALLTQNEAARSSVSGVNLDEEAANLIKYQQAYQASAKSLDIATKLFDVLLSISN